VREIIDAGFRVPRSPSRKCESQTRLRPCNAKMGLRGNFLPCTAALRQIVPPSTTTIVPSANPGTANQLITYNVILTGQYGWGQPGNSKAHRGWVSVNQREPGLQNRRHSYRVVPMNIALKALLIAEGSQRGRSIRTPR
jgi:hypothetical protein